MICQQQLYKILLPAIIFLSVLSLNCGDDDPSDFKRVTFRVITPPDSGAVFITGNQSDLGDWEAGKVKLARESDTSWINKFYFRKGELVEYKFTKGSWQTEALDTAGIIPENFFLKVLTDTIVTVRITDWARSRINGRIFISSSLLVNNKGSVLFEKDFKFHPGDSLKWKETGFNDSHWSSADPSLAENILPVGWNGIGWFRLNFWVDSTLWGKPAGININHMGASDIYFNGEHLFSTGVVGSDSAGFRPEQRRIWKSLIWKDTTHQLIAVRFANYDWMNLHEKGFSAGFELRLKEIDNTISSTFTEVRTITNYQVLFTVVPFTLAVLHLFIFVFYPYDRQNLFYSLCLFAFATLSFSINQRYVSTDVSSIIFYYSLVPISITFALLFGLYTTYSGSGIKFPRQHYIFLAIAVGISAAGVIKPFQDLFIVIYPFMGLCMYEMVRVIIKSRERTQSSVFIIVGFFFLALSVLYQILIDIHLLPPPAGYSLVFGYGILALIFSMSMALSYNFAKINKNLKEQLTNVEVLSQINIERERSAKKTEIERTLLEADNKRKTEELEEARKLQLSFLPKTIPAFKGYDIEVYMKTATEVGGDYYDFQTNNDTLTIVIGDATGHGARAGTMVAAVKSLFSVLADESEPLTIIKKYTIALKSMNLHNLYMSLSVSKLQNNSLQYCSAGMPPMFIYRCAQGIIEEVVQKTMPLGSFTDFPYIQKSFHLENGDTLLFLSDGFTEAFNPENELLGIQKVKDIFLTCADRNVEEIINHMRLEVEQWQAGVPPKDDITFIVIKKCS